MADTEGLLHPGKIIDPIPINNEERINMRNGFFHLAATTALTIALSVSSAFAQKKYDTGATDTEIKIGQTNPFSGPASAYATIGKTQAAYIKMIKDRKSTRLNSSHRSLSRMPSSA